MKDQLLRGAVLSAALFAVAPASATVILSDTFDDGDVSDWTRSTNHDTAFVIATAEDAVSAPYAMETYLTPGQQGGDFFVRATRSFDLAAAATDVTLSFSGRARPCGGCTMRYQAFIDGVMVFDGIDTSFTAQALSLGDLAAGAHTLTLGHFTDAASSGRFSALFDDVLIEGTLASTGGVPEPASWAMMIGGLGLVGGAMRRRARAVAFA